MGKPEKIELINLLEEKARRRKYNAIRGYKPYPKQALFHKLSATTSERALGAGNQLGKTLAGSMEEAFHATGLYPDWWEGHKFTKPTVSWVGGDTGERKLKTNLILATDKKGRNLYLVRKNKNSSYPKFTDRGIIG